MSDQKHNFLFPQIGVKVSKRLGDLLSDLNVLGKPLLSFGRLHRVSSVCCLEITIECEIECREFLFSSIFNLARHYENEYKDLFIQVRYQYLDIKTEKFKFTIPIYDNSDIDFTTLCFSCLDS